ncbi:ATP-binding protein [Patescibacteria group bacterium]|nr:ATP-binding protein [Patescibacteria group bacterium]
MGSLNRIADSYLKNHFNRFKEVLVLLGPRQSGKTTILKKLFPEAIYFTADNEATRKNLESFDVSVYKQIFPQNRIIVLDEIHLLSNPGRAAKIVYDQIPDRKLIITGSSSLNIKNRASESLAGRKIDYHLYPLTFSEYLTQNGIEPSLNNRVFENIIKETPLTKKAHNFDLAVSLKTALTYGFYPATINHPDKRKYLENLVDSVVFKDLLDLKLLDDRRAALETLKLLAHQIGQLVNYSEIAQRVGKDARTVKKYIDVFCQSFIIFELLPFSQVSRDEIGKSPKIYFYDLGLRNALIESFSDINIRSDRGLLFENFIISEFLKANTYLSAGFKVNYWRTKSGSEVDLVISREKDLLAVEIKYNQERIATAFTNRYPQAKIKNITSENFY